MADERWKATAAIVVAGKAVRTGDTLIAPEEAVADAVTRGLVEPAPEKPEKRGKP